MRTAELAGIHTLFIEAEGAPISVANDVIGDAWSVEAALIVIPVERLDPAFFDLSSLVAGEFLQKIVNYRLRIAIVGDIARFTESSGALRDFVWESNRGTQVWFVDDEAALEGRLAP